MCVTLKPHVYWKLLSLENMDMYVLRLGVLLCGDNAHGMTVSHNRFIVTTLVRLFIP